MTWSVRLRRRLRALLHREEVVREMNEETRFHIDMEAEDLVRTRSLAPHEARRQAIVAYRGNWHFLGAMRGRSLEGLLADIRYAIRGCVKRPAFASAAILTLALGIGASTAIFSVVYGVLLKPLPFDEAEGLVTLLHRKADDQTTVNHGPATYFIARENQRVFEGIGAWESNDVSITGRGDPERVEALAVSDATLPLLRVPAMRGRLFTREDDAPGAPLRVILTSGYWQRRFGGANDAVGQLLQIDGQPAEIIGVLPPSFRFLRQDPAILIPMQLERPTTMGIEFDFAVLARLKPGVSLEQANNDMARWLSLLPPAFARLALRPNVLPLADEVRGEVGRVLWILLAAVGVVMLIACGNVANLFLVRVEGRQQELSLRTALGASRARLARVLLTESILLSLAGGALGLVLAQAALGLLRRMAPAQLPRVSEIGLDPAVLLFALAISVVSGALFGLVAVVRLGTPGVTALKEGGRGASAGPGRLRARNALVVTQIALALTLLIVSGLMIRTFVAMRGVPPGFVRPEQVQTFRLDIPEGLIAQSKQAALTYQNIAARLSEVRGVTAVGLSSSVTMDGEDNGNPVYVEDILQENPPLRRFKSVGPGYFEAMGIRLVAGRSITWEEIQAQRPVIVISDSLAREYWQDPAKAIGRRIRGITSSESGQIAWREIVGVVGDERDDGLTRPATAIVYWPLLNEIYDWRGMAFVVRSSRVGTPGFLRELQNAVWSVNPNLPVADARTLDSIVADSMAQTSFAMVMLAISAGVALILGIVGIYGVIAYVAAQRTREIGIRMALGAQIGDVRKMFLRHGLSLTAAGIACGIVAALVLTRVMSALLFGVGPMDPVTYVAVSGLLAIVALMATYLPARRAAKVDPVVALRAEA